MIDSQDFGGIAPNAPLLSIHDVMPETLDEVRGILAELGAWEPLHPLLLVVPGKPWRDEDLSQLRAWVEQGAILAGHGWSHQAPPARRLYHRMHSLLISRNVAEHLALDTEGIAALITRNHQWFGDHNLPAPKLYVPPAWAMGRVDAETLAGLPFRYYESLRGIYDAQNRQFHHLPLAGYEADTCIRALALAASNALNRSLARRCNRPLRIAIHPFDLRYRLRGELLNTLGRMRGVC